MPRPRVLLLAPHLSYRIAPFLEAAARLDIELLLASEGRYSLVGAIAAGIHVDLTQPDAALARLLAAVDGNLAGVVASDDATVELAARVAAALGLAHNAPASARLTRRKDLARACLAAAGLPVPAHRRIDLTAPLAPQIHGLAYPCVIKPLSMSASRGVIRADDPAALGRAAVRLRAITAELTDPEERDHALIEAYLPGFEVALEGLLSHGRLRVLALFDKPDPLEGPYFEETYYITPSRLTPALQARVAERVAAACTAYGLREGPIHAELRVHAGEAWILEVAARTIGGECARLLRLSTGRGLEELVLEQALGRDPVLEPASGGAGVLMIPIPRAGILRRVEGLLAAQRVPHIEDVTLNLREGYELIPLPEGSSYFGHIYARAPDAHAAEAALRAAHAELRIVTAPLVRLQADPAAPPTGGLRG
ncbi:MAG: ATP-grasp domain-containing protein [Thiohalobacteraceae bacterium]